MSKPDDYLARERALCPQSSFIVQAPAGSGKTELLTQRVLKLLTTVNEPEEILAITFTKKAASEMRQRVVETLELAASKPHVTDPYDVERLALASAALAQDEARGWQLLRNPQRINLRTIDSLGTHLAHRLPVTSTLGAPTGISENATDLYYVAAERFIESNLESLTTILLHLGNKVERAQSLFANLLGKRDQWQRHLRGIEQNHDQLREFLENVLEQLIESRLAYLCSLLPEELGQKLPQILARAYELKLAVEEGDESAVPDGMKLWQQMSELPGEEAAELEHWRSVAFALLTSAKALRKKVTVAEGFPARTQAKNLGVEAQMLIQHKADMVDVLNALAEHPAFIVTLGEVRELPLPVYRDDQWALLSELLTVLPGLLLELKLVFAEHALIDFAEVSQRASIALGTEDEPTDLALAMDLSLQHLLVDEFQDTSQTQFHLFEKLVSEWLPGDGKTFFAVGDPMQSIYRFREGDVALFSQVQEAGIGRVDVEALTLTVNFRSSPVVTDWVNTTFSQIFPTNVDPDTGAVPYSPSSAFFDYEGSVAVHGLVDQDREQQGVHVAQLCANAIKGDDDHTVAILVRSRSQAVEIFSALRACELPYESIDMDLVGDKAVVRDLVALTLALRYPHDRLHWLSVLRAPFVGLLLHDLHALVQSEDKRVAVVDQLRDNAVVETLSDDAKQRVGRFLSIIEPALKQSSRVRLMPWVESVWLQLGGPVICKDDLDRDAAKRALKTLYELEARNELWKKSTIESAMAGLYANPSDATGSQIQVMTLHKSKGLEFDTVILPALDRRPRGESTQMLNWFELTLDGEPQLIIAPFEQSGLDTNSRDKLIKLVKRAGERCDAEEKLRLLYVACTRAKRHLYLVGNVGTAADGEMRAPVASSLLAPLWPLFQSEFVVSGERAVDKCDATGSASILPEQLSLIPEDDEPEAPRFFRLPGDVQLPGFDYVAWDNPVALAPDEEAESEVDYYWAGRDARDIGTVVHDQLQLLAGLDESDQRRLLARCRESASRQLGNLGMSDSRLHKALEKVSIAIANTLDDERGRWILADHAEGKCEWALSVPLVDAAEVEHNTHFAYTPVQNIIIDRTFVDADGTRWIVDYKTGEHEGGDVATYLDNEQKRYAPQLNRYANVIQRFDKRPIKVGLYFPMIKGWQEWEPDAA